MIVRTWLLSAAALMLVLGQSAVAHADLVPAASLPAAESSSSCTFEACGGAITTTADGSYRVTVWSSSGASYDFVTNDGGHAPHHYEWSWVPTCDTNSPGSPDSLCATATQSCPTPGDINFWVYYRAIDIPGDTWHRVGTQCLGPDPTLPLGQAQQQVERQFRDLPLDAGAVHVQPNGKAVVNLPTIFYAETPRQLHFTVTALGRTVDLTATPQAWHWHWGDGTADGLSHEPGAAYPHESVTHRYREADRVQAWVTVDWVATYRIAGVAQVFSITDPVPVRSNVVTITVREARSELVSR